MKFITKGIIIMLILFNSSLISLSKKISINSFDRILLGRKKSSAGTNNQTYSNRFSNKASSKTKLQWEDWKDTTLLLPIAFAKGVCSLMSISFS